MIPNFYKEISCTFFAIQSSTINNPLPIPPSKDSATKSTKCPNPNTITFESLNSPPFKIVSKISNPNSNNPLNLLIKPVRFPLIPVKQHKETLIEMNQKISEI